MSNSISFVGHCSGDSKVRTVNGSTVLEVTVANNVGYGEKQHTNWLRINYWTKNAEKLADYFVKGQPVFVNGELTSNEYTTQDGTKRFQLLVKANSMDFVGKKSSSDDKPSTASNYDYYADAPF